MIRACIINIHPAPYRDPVLDEVASRGKIQLRILNLFGSNAAQPYLAEAQPRTAIPASRSKYPMHHLALRIARHLADRDVVFVSGYFHGTTRLALAYCAWRGKRVILVADSERPRPVPSVFRSVKDRVLRRLARRLAGVWVPGRASRDYWSRMGVSENRIFEGAYCLDTETLSRQAAEARTRRASLRAHLGIPPAAFVFLFVGKLISDRGLGFLADAYSQVKAVRDEVMLLAVGDGPEEGQLYASVAGPSRSGLRVVPPVSFQELPNLYGAADAYTQASTYEPYSLSTLQAAVSELPVIATDAVGSVCDFSVDGDAAVVVPAANPGSLASAMMWVIEHQRERAAMAQLARSRAITRNVQWAATEFEHACTLTV